MSSVIAIFRRWASAMGNARRKPFGSPVLSAVSMAGLAIASVLVLQSSPRAEVELQLSDGAVWLSSTAIGGISLLDGGSGTIVASLGVAAPGDDFDVSQWGSDAIVVNRTEGTVARIDGATWSIATGRVQFGEPGQPLHLVADERGTHDGWVTTPGQAAPIQLEELTQQRAVPVAAPFADGVVTAGGSLLLSSTEPTAPLRRVISDGSEPETIDAVDGPTSLHDLDGAIVGVDLDDRRVWVESVGIVCDRLEFPADAVLHAANADHQLIVVSDSGGAFVWDPIDHGCPRSDEFINLGPGEYGEPALTDGWAVVPDNTTAAVLVIDLDDMILANRQELVGIEPGSTIDLVAEDGSIWYNDPATAMAGLVRRDGSIVPVEKYEEGQGGFTAAPVEGADGDVQVAGLAVDNPNDPPENTDEVTDPAGTPAVAFEDDETDAPRAETEDGGPTPTIPAPATQPDEQSPEVPTPDNQQPDEQPDEQPDQQNPDEEPNDGGTPDTTEGTTPQPPPQEEPVIEISMGVSATQVTAGDSINFTALTTHGSPNNWTSSVSPNGPTLQPIEKFGSFRYLFPEPGVFVVSIEACDPDDNCDTARAQVEIVVDPDAVDLIPAINGPTSARVGDQVTLRDATQGEPETWTWDTDGGTPATSSDQNPTISWDTVGPKTVSLTVERNGSRKTTTFRITIEEAAAEPSPFGLRCSPVALTVGDTASCSLEGDPADFDNLGFSTSADSGGTIDRSDLGIGRLAVSYNTEGNVTVVLSGTDKGTGEPVSASDVLAFAGLACAAVVPSASITGPTSLLTDESGSYNGSGDVCGGASYSWSAEGNAAISSPSAATTSISWPNAGTYVVTLNFSSGGGSTSATRTVVVSDPASDEPCFSVDGPSNLDTNESGTFTVTDPCGVADGSSATWTTTGAGGSGSGNSFTAAWATAGTYEVTATVSPGITPTVTVTVTDTGPPPDPAPQVSINGPSTLDTGQAGTFSAANSGGTITDYAWSATGTQATSSSATFAASWASVSTYQVTLTVTGPGGTDTATFAVTVDLPPVEPSPFGLSCNVGTAEVDQIFRCTLAGDPANFTNPGWSVGPASAQYWNMDTWTYDAAGTVAGTVSVSLSATDLATGLTVSDSVTVTITDPPPPPPPAPDPPPSISVSCNVGTASTVGTRFTCSLSSGNAALLSNPDWSVSGSANLFWGGDGTFSIDVQGTEPGAVTIQILATHIASGELVSASTTVNIS